MKFSVLFAVLMLFAVSSSGCAGAAPASAVEVPVYVHDSDQLRAQLLGKACDDPRVMEMLVVGMPEHVDRFKVVEADFKMRGGEWKHYTGCWAELTEAEVGVTTIALLFEDGDYYLVPKAEFLRGKGQGT